MSTVLLDTTVASLLHPKKTNDALRIQYQTHMEGQILAISFQTVAELWSWAEDNDWGTTLRAGLEIFLQKFLVIPYDPELAQTWHDLPRTASESGEGWKRETVGSPPLQFTTNSFF